MSDMMRTDIEHAASKMASRFGAKREDQAARWLGSLGLDVKPPPPGSAGSAPALEF